MGTTHREVPGILQDSGFTAGRITGSLIKAVLLAVLVLAAFGAIAASSASADGTIIATKGGDRTASSSVDGATTYASNVAGATFEYTTDDTLPQTGWTAFPAVTGANGQASAVVPTAGSGSSGTIYFVREKTPGPGFQNYGPVQNLSYNGDQPYVARVRVETDETTYAYPHADSSSDPDDWTPRNVGSTQNDGSPFINVRDNAPLQTGCGINVLLVLDRSGSTEPYKDDYEDAAKSFVNSLNGTPTQIGITSFNDEINSYQPATGDNDFYHSPLSLSTPGNAGTLNTTISNIYDDPNSNTNWDGALQAASKAKDFAANGVTGQSTNPDVVVFITDGNPTVNDTDSGSSSLFNLTSGMASANLVKTQVARPGAPGTKLKMLAIGVGGDVTNANLKAVSGPNEGITNDWAAPSVAELEATLNELAASQCGARVYVRKHLANDSTNQEDWFYTAVDSRGAPHTPTYLDGDRSTHPSGTPSVTETGAFFTQLPETATMVSVNEDAAGQPTGNFSLTDVDCQRGSYNSGVAVPGTQTGLNYSLSVNRGDAIYCTYTNTPKTTLSVTKTPDAQTINAGADAEFTIDVKNTGTNTAVNPKLSDQLPTPGVGGWTITQPAGGTCSVNGANLLTCDFDDMAGGATKTVKVKTGTNAQNCAVYNNPTATASADNANPVSDAGKITCQKPALTITKTPNAQNINAGENVVFTITVSNSAVAGTGTATGVKVNDPLPAGVSGAWVASGANAGDCVSPIAASTLDCTFGTLAPGASKTVTVTAPTNFANCLTYDNTASLTSTNAPNANDAGQVTCQKPALTITKTPNSQNINAGDPVVFTITVSNSAAAGTGTATGVKVNDPLPAGVSGAWVASGADAGDCVSPIAASTLDCTFGTLAPGASKTVTVTAPTNTQNCATYDNTANLTSTNAPNASDEGQVTCQPPGLGVIKTAVSGTINAGDNAVFDITVSNTGSGTATGVKLNDPLPAGVSGAWVVSGPDAADCVSPIVGNTLDCDFGDLGAGASKKVTVTAPTNFDNCATIDNEATATSTNAPDASDSDTIDCQKPALTITKTPNAQNINAGENVVFTITVSNSAVAGTGTAKAVKVSDNLPIGVSGAWVDSGANAADCNVSAGNPQVLDCDFGDLAPGASKTVTVTAPTNTQNCSTYDNTASLTSTNAPNASDAGQVSCQKPALTITKTPNSQNINAGDPVVFTITVTNSDAAGTGTAKDVKVSDPLPSGVSGAWVASGADAGDCVSPIAASTLDCSFGDLAPGASKTVTVTAPTDTENCATYDNTANLTAGNAPNASDEGQVTCQPPGLGVIKTAVSGTINAGDDAVFDITVSNTGTGQASGVKLSDPLPAGVSGAWVVSGPDAAECDSPIVGNTLNCDFGDLAAGASKKVTVTAPTNFDNCATLDNEATATSTNAPDASDSDSIDCQKPNLTITKTPNAQNINAGEDVIFTITVSNTGAGTATGVKVNDPLPAGVSGAWVASGADAGDCVSPIAANTLDCTFGDLTAGASKTVTVTAPTDAEDCAVYDNTANLTSTNAPDASDDGQVTCQPPGLGVIKTAVSGTINAGDNAVFEITVSNTGTGVAKGVKLNDPLPTGVSGAWVVSGPDAADCSVAGNPAELDCDFGDLAAGASKKVTVTAATNFDNCATLDNEATATSTNAPDASDSDSIDCQKPALTITKTPNSQNINAGDPVVFTITVTNSDAAGTGTAKDVKVSDPLPAGVSGAWVASGADAGDCVSPIAADTLDCTFGDLAAGASKTVIVTAPTDAENCATYDNTANLTAGNAPEASDEASITCNKPSLSVEKTGNGPVNAGEDIGYTIQVSNGGPGTASSVSLTDPLPAGAAGTWSISSQPAGDPCSITDEILNCGFGDMAAGTNHSVSVTAPTSAEACGVYDNKATATAIVGQVDETPTAQELRQAAVTTIEASGEATVICNKPVLSLTKIGNGPVKAGSPVKFTMKVTNAGPGLAKGVKLSDPLPNGTATAWKIEKQPAGNHCTIAGGKLDCDYGDMAAGDSAEVRIAASTSPGKCKVYDNTATESADNAADETADATVRCNQVPPKLTLKKTANKKKVFPGGKVRFTVKIRNARKHSVAKNLKICDTIPGGMSVVNKGKGHFENGKLCWNVKSLHYSKAPKKFHYTARVNGNVNPGSRLKNVVRVENLKASRTVRVKRPAETKPARTPVTG